MAEYMAYKVISCFLFLEYQYFFTGCVLVVCDAHIEIGKIKITAYNGLRARSLT